MRLWCIFALLHHIVAPNAPLMVILVIEYLTLIRREMKTIDTYDGYKKSPKGTQIILEKEEQGQNASRNKTSWISMSLICTTGSMAN